MVNYERKTIQDFEIIPFEGGCEQTSEELIEILKKYPGRKISFSVYEDDDKDEGFDVTIYGHYDRLETDCEYQRRIEREENTEKDRVKRETEKRRQMYENLKKEFG